MELLKQNCVDLEYVNEQLYKIGSLPSAYNIFPEIVKWIGYIGAGIIGLGLIAGLFYLWIRLNMMKYKR